MRSRTIRLIAFGALAAWGLALGGCWSSHSTSGDGSDEQADKNKPADVVMPVDVPIDNDPQLVALAGLVKVSGGSFRVYRLPTEGLPQEVLNNYSAEDSQDGPRHVEIDLRGIKVSDAQLAQLAEAPAYQQVTDIILSDTTITDESLALIAKAERLRFLTISGTGVTDRGLEHLMGHKNLSFIFLDRWSDGRGISAKAEERLMRSLPKRFGP